MRLDLLSRVLFVIYCVEAGAVLLLAPWTGGWERLAMQLPAGLRGVCLHPALRSLVSGFGILHLVWGAHDLELLLGRWRSRARPPS